MSVSSFRVRSRGGARASTRDDGFQSSRGTPIGVGTSFTTLRPLTIGHPARHRRQLFYSSATVCNVRGWACWCFMGIRRVANPEKKSFIPKLRWLESPAVFRGGGAVVARYVESRLTSHRRSFTFRPVFRHCSLQAGDRFCHLARSGGTTRFGTRVSSPCSPPPSVDPPPCSAAPGAPRARASTRCARARPPRPTPFRGADLSAVLVIV